MARLYRSFCSVFFLAGLVVLALLLARDGLI